MPLFSKDRLYIGKHFFFCNQCIGNMHAKVGQEISQNVELFQEIDARLE